MEVLMALSAAQLPYVHEIWCNVKTNGVDKVGAYPWAGGRGLICLLILRYHVNSTCSQFFKHRKTDSNALPAVWQSATAIYCPKTFLVVLFTFSKLPKQKGESLAPGLKKTYCRGSAGEAPPPPLPKR